MTKGNYTDVILEEVRDQYKKIQEGLDSLQGLPTKVDKLDEDMQTVKSDLKTIKAVQRDQGHQVQDHEKRLTKLETVSSN
jgi:prefoldin subunit 5